MYNSTVVDWRDRVIGIEDDMSYLKGIKEVQPPASLIYRHLSKRERLETCTKYINRLRNKGADYRGMVEIDGTRQSIWDMLLSNVMPDIKYGLVGLSYPNRFCNLLAQKREAMVNDLMTPEYIRNCTAEVREDMQEWRDRMKYSVDPDATARTFIEGVFGVKLAPPPPPDPEQDRVVPVTYEAKERYKALKQQGLM
jgi:hypothetical protein